MYTNLPVEILEQIFTDPDFTSDSLCQLQLTCKQWSPIAQKYLYKEIWLEEQSVFGDHAYESRRLAEQLKLLTRTLVFFNTPTRNLVKSIYTGSLFELDDPELKFAILAQLCPNIRDLSGSNSQETFYDTISDLHRSGNLQKVEYISMPSPTYGIHDSPRKSLIQSYNKTITLLKGTLKEITLMDGIGRSVMSNDDIIQPYHLQHFSHLECLNLREFSRIHLSRMEHYISNSSCPGTKKIKITMTGRSATSLSTEHNVTPSITPNTHVQELSISLYSAPLIQPSEMAFIMRMFPSLQDFYFYISSDKKADITPIRQHDDVEVAIRFLEHLLRLRRFSYFNVWFGVSEGMGLLPRLANSTEISGVSIVSVAAKGPVALSMGVNPDVGRTIKTKRFSITIEVYSHDPESYLYDALESFKNNPVKNLTVGLKWSSPWGPQSQKITEVSMECIMERFTSLQQLTFFNAEFPSEVPLSRATTRKHLRELQLQDCNITHAYFDKLSQVLEKVDHLIFRASVTLLERNHGGYTKGHKVITIYLPHTTIVKLDLSIGWWETYCLNIWRSNNYIDFNAYADIRRSSCQVVVHCKNLKEVCFGNKTYTLP